MASLSTGSGYVQSRSFLEVPTPECLVQLCVTSASMDACVRDMNVYERATVGLNLLTRAHPCI
jgi:hypothetical protein